MTNISEFDVVIFGGGLAGLTLVRQLKLELPQLSVAVIDRHIHPFPEAAFLVGKIIDRTWNLLSRSSLKTRQIFQGTSFS